MENTLEIVLNNCQNEPCAKQVEYIVSYILERDGKVSPESRYTGPQIIEKYAELKNLYPDRVPSIAETTLSMYISRASTDTNSLIYKHSRKYGYYVLNSSNPVTASGTPNVSQVNQDDTKKQKEVDFYPIFLEWLTYSCPKVADIHTETKMKQWGNPDLLGIRFYDIVGSLNVELTTIEVKRDLVDWRKNIFEAVSHTRFAHRVYYAFVCTQTEYDKFRNEIISYAQQFNIGLLALIKLNSSSKDWMKAEKIIEILPAPNCVPSVSNLQKFLNSLDINNFEKMCQYGK